MTHDVCFHCFFCCVPGSGPVRLVSAQSGCYPAQVEETYQVKLPVFEGPLDLLLHLIRKNEVDIHDIPIALITGQYVEYVELMKELNIEVAGEFLVMAATLIHIKSRMLLPRTIEAGETDDPRLEIALPLLEYVRFREAARRLDDRPWLERERFGRGDVSEVEPVHTEPGLFNLGLFDLLDAFRRVMDNLSHRRTLAVEVDRISVQERLAQMMDVFRIRESMIFEDLFESDRTRGAVVVTFLALLEAVRMGLVSVIQETAFGTIRLDVRAEAFEPEETATDEARDRTETRA